MLINPFPYYAKGIHESTVYPPLGLAYLGATMESNGIDCRILDANILRMPTRDVIRELVAYDPDVVGIYTNIVLARAAFELSRTVKERLGTTVVLGGPYATSAADRALEHSQADFVVRGEGEETFLELVQKLGAGDGTGKIRGISFRSGDRVVHNADREPIAELDALAFPAVHLLPPLNTYRSRARRRPIATMFTSRGCPYGCVYCNKNIFGRGFRARSAENVIAEIERLTREHGVREIDVLDDNFTFDIERAEAILDGIVERGMDIAINLQGGLRADRLTRRLVRKMKRAGVFKVGLGIETGSDRMLTIIRKSLDRSKVGESIRWMREEGIIVYGFFMVGLPYETEADIRATIDFAKEVDPHVASFAVTMPLPGTEFYEMIERDGEFLRSMEEGVEQGWLSDFVCHRLGELDEETIRRFTKRAYREFFFRPSKILDVAATTRSLNELLWIKDSIIAIAKDVLTSKM